MNKPEPVPSAETASAAQVFISYATADRKEALAVTRAIESRGTKCWISSRDVRPGENYQEAIVRTIRNSRAMVLVFSDAANNSDEIKKELSLASKHHVPVMALRIEDVEPSDAFAYELSTRQWIDAFENWDRSVDALVETLNQVQHRDSISAQSPSTATRRRARLTSRTKMMAGAAVAVAIVATGCAWFLLRPIGPTHSMQVRLTGFSSLSPDLPRTLPTALNDELDAAFNDDGVIGVSTASSPPPGNGPAYALGGTIARDGEKVKVIVRLTDERSGASLWSNNYSYDSTNFAHVSRWASVDVSQVVRCGLFGASTYPKALPEAVLTEYVQFCGHTSPAKDRDLAQRIVAAVPDFSWGWSAMTSAIDDSAHQQSAGPKHDELLKQARAAADRAIKLDPSNSEAFWLKSTLIDQSDLLGREALLKKAISARPLACGCEHHVYGGFLMQVGRMTDAIREFQQSTDVLPLNASTQLGLGDAMTILGNPNSAAQHFDAALDLVDLPSLPDNITVRKAEITGQTGGADKAILSTKIGVPTQNTRALADGFAALDSKNASAKSAALAELNSLPMEWISSPEIPLMAALGDHSDAMKYLEGNVHRGYWGALEWMWYPSMDGVRRDPAFAGLLQRLGLIHYWKTTHTRPDVCTDKNPPPFCSII